MLQTIFTISDHVFGVPLFGFGLLLGLWAIGSLVLLVWLAWRQGFNADTRSYLPILLVIGAVIYWVLPALAEENHGLPIRGYGVMLFLGVVGGTALTVWRGYRLGLDPDMVMTLVFWGFVPGIIGAQDLLRGRVLERFPCAGGDPVADLHPYPRRDRQYQQGRTGGLRLAGRRAGGVPGVHPPKKAAALGHPRSARPGMLLGLALGRIGCFMNGCCFGGPCELPWAVQFPAGSPPYVRQVQEGELFVHGLKFHQDPMAPPVIAAVEPGSPAERQGLKPGQTIRSVDGKPVTTVHAAEKMLLDAQQPAEELTVATVEGPRAAQWEDHPAAPPQPPIHPTQLYGAIWALLLCLFLLAYDPFARRDGELIALLLTLYPINRFLLECIRTDEPGVFGTPLHTGQVVSLIALAAAAGLWWHILRRRPGRALSPT